MIYLLEIVQKNNQYAIAELLKHVSKYKIPKIENLIFTEDKLISVFSDLLSQYLISLAEPKMTGKIELVVDRYGRPYNNDGKNLYFKRIA